VRYAWGPGKGEHRSAAASQPRRVGNLAQGRSCSLKFRVLRRARLAGGAAARLHPVPKDGRPAHDWFQARDDFDALLTAKASTGQVLATAFSVLAPLTATVASALLIWPHGGSAPGSDHPPPPGTEPGTRTPNPLLLRSRQVDARPT